MIVNTLIQLLSLCLILNQTAAYYANPPDNPLVRRGSYKEKKDPLAASQISSGHEMRSTFSQSESKGFSLKSKSKFLNSDSQSKPAATKPAGSKDAFRGDSRFLSDGYGIRGEKSAVPESRGLTDTRKGSYKTVSTGDTDPLKSGFSLKKD